MKRFNIGQRVIALTVKRNEFSQPRTKGKVYHVQAIRYCGLCGTQKINVAGALPKEYSPITPCNCGAEYSNLGLWFTDSVYFAPLEDVHLLINQAEQDEDYELAQTLLEVQMEEINIDLEGLNIGK